MSKNVLKAGDYVHTNQIDGCSEGEEEVQITKIKKDLACIVYGSYYDRAWVELKSCTFIRQGEVSSSDLKEPNPYVFT
jgi:hypothetical protein